jgi:hypothetical protein
MMYRSRCASGCCTEPLQLKAAIIPPRTTQAEVKAVRAVSQRRRGIESLCMHLPRHGDSIIVCDRR